MIWDAIRWYNIIHHNIIYDHFTPGRRIGRDHMIWNCEVKARLVDVRGAKVVPRKGVWASVDMRVWTCREFSAKHHQTSCYLRPPVLGTHLVHPRVEGRAAGSKNRLVIGESQANPWDLDCLPCAGRMASRTACTSAPLWLARRRPAECESEASRLRAAETGRPVTARIGRRAPDGLNVLLRAGCMYIYRERER